MTNVLGKFHHGDYMEKVVSKEILCLVLFLTQMIHIRKCSNNYKQMLIMIDGDLMEMWPLELFIMCFISIFVTTSLTPDDS